MTDNDNKIKEHIEKLILDTDQHDRIECLVRALTKLDSNEFMWFQHFEHEHKED